MIDKKRFPSFSMMQIASAWFVGLCSGTAFGLRDTGWRLALVIPVVIGSISSVVAILVTLTNYWESHD